MIIKLKKNHTATSTGLPVIFHSHEKNEIRKFTRAFHSGCKYVKDRRIGCAGISYGKGISKTGVEYTKV